MSQRSSASLPRRAGLAGPLNGEAMPAARADGALGDLTAGLIACPAIRIVFPGGLNLARQGRSAPELEPRHALF